jgi:hypothetical protein
MRQDNAEGSSSSASVLSLRQQEVLVGTLLGDGCLAKHGYYHRLHIKHAAAQRALVDFKYEVFRDLISMRQHEFDQQLKGRGAIRACNSQRAQVRLCPSGTPGSTGTVAKWFQPTSLAIYRR